MNLHQRKRLLFSENEITNIRHNDKKSYISYWKSQYKQQLKKLKLTIRLATMDDKERVMTLRHRRFTVPNSYSTHWLYHLFNYGSCLMLENEANELIGYKFEATYANTTTVSFTAGTAVDERYSHLGLGKILIGYSHLVALEKGAAFNRGIIAITNYSSIYNFINYFGGVFTDFEPHFKDYGARLIYEIPLDFNLLPFNSVKKDSIQAYIEKHQIKKDYLLIPCNDIEALSNTYQHTDFRIVALLPKGWIENDKELFLAIE